MGINRLFKSGMLLKKVEKPCHCGIWSLRPDRSYLYACLNFALEIWKGIRLIRSVEATSLAMTIDD
jgi:hypothetical protein